MGKEKRKYDFAGWVTKNDIKCSDGVTIKQGAFKNEDGAKVPLVWNHNYDSPNSVLGHIILTHHDNGVYGYGHFNDTTEGQNAKKMVEHGDVSSMSIGARKIKRSGDNVIHGMIYEVSLVLAGANPGAMIDSVITHAENDEEEAIVYTGNLIHSADDVIDDPAIDKEEVINHGDEQTIEDVIATMNDTQKEAVYVLLGAVADSKALGDEEELNDDEKGDDEPMKQNVFDKEKQDKNSILRHSATEALQQAIATKASSFKDVLAAVEIKDGDVITHGINSIEMLFPEAAHSTNGNVPTIYKDPNTAYTQILNAVSKSPFARVKTTWFDLTEEEARAKGYIKGNLKKEEFFSLIKRVTGPTTIYKKQKLDRDDIIDIEDFDIVSFLNMEMRMMIEEEMARALLVGDGREFDHPDKINEEHIRPVISDHDFFTLKRAYANAAAFEESVINSMTDYRGSGSPTMYVDPAVINATRLLKGEDGRYLTGSLPSLSELAARWGLGGIVPTSFMIGKGALIVNLRDYNIGAAKGGQLTTFDDFDIDFNQYKYLIETRLSGALTMAASAIHLKQGTAGTGANNDKAGMTYGSRQADKTPPVVTP